MLTDPIKDKKDLETLKGYFLKNGNVRDYALFTMGINSGIEISDLIALKWSDVYDSQKGDFLATFNFTDGRTGKEMQAIMTENCKSALAQLLKTRTEGALTENFIFTSKKGGHITRFRAFQIIKEATENCGIKGNFSCRSMRKTHAYHIERARAMVVAEL